ncbi:hypothetical protein NA57DRAFT_49180 [Rhizodiscina lignyota]|uniref:Glutaredoxin-like protein n=1 Tax=Rhizodiscina lignyota TaxID=1504668 RepID=A0A9P4M0Z0_9PEZI|nr:hypothetical protein NA57DRAFT_49180 [Rhizodiscina lignyota]
MRITRPLLQHALRITLFTRANCALCDQAKLVLSHAWDKKPFDFAEIDVMARGQEQWKELYEFDTPVIHVQRASTTSADVRKAMHRFSAQHVLQLMADADGEGDDGKG